MLNVKKMLMKLAGKIKELDNDKATVVTGEWTPKLHDLDTLKYTLPTCLYVKIGSLYVMLIPQVSISTALTINTMLQIRGFPCSMVCGGNIYLSTFTGQGGDRTIQASTVGAYMRPNITGTLSANTLITGIFFGL